MSDDLEHVRPASTAYGDWRGTASADASAMADSIDVYQALDIDRDRWFVVGLEAHGDLTKPGIVVLAVDKHATGIDRNGSVPAYAEAHGSVPVTSFYAHKVPAAGLFIAMFNQFALQLRLRGTEAVDLTVTDRADIGLEEG